MPGRSKPSCGQAGFRATGDYRPEKIGSKIRDAQLQLIPYMLIIGGREAESGSVSIRDRIEGDVGSLTVAAAIEKLRAEVAAKVVRQVAGRSPMAALAEQGGPRRTGRRPCLLEPPAPLAAGQTLPKGAG